MAKGIRRTRRGRFNRFTAQGSSEMGAQLCRRGRSAAQSDARGRNLQGTQQKGIAFADAIRETK